MLWKKEISILGRFDVIVVGGGVAGISAALAASRNGANVALIERYGYLGGLATGGLVIAVPPPESKKGYGGIMQEILDKLRSMEEAFMYEDGSWIFNPEAFKVVAEDLMKEAKVKILFESAVIDVLTNEGSIKGVILHNKSGIQCILGKVIVDATGDGDVAAYAGAPFIKREKRKIQEMTTMMYILGNVDNEKVKEYQKVDPGMRKAAERAGFLMNGEYRGPSFIHLDKLFKGMVLVWGGAVKHDVTNVEELTSAWLDLRKEVVREFDFMKRYVPGFQSCRIFQTSHHLGVREARKIIGEYVLTEDDVGKKLEDAIIYCGDYYVPYRALLPKNVDNLLIAGRCILAPRDNIRYIPACIATGQAAGTAAALSIKMNVKPKNLNYSLLRKVLEDQGLIYE